MTKSNSKPPGEGHTSCFRQFMRAWSGVVFLGMFFSSGELARADEAPDIWEEVDVVPMPKEIALTGKNPALEASRFVLVVGDTASRQSQLGAEWINKRIVQLGGSPLPILKASDKVQPNVIPIIIGTTEDNALIADAVTQGRINVGAKNPGVRGYGIRFEKDEAVLLAGADSLGVLYACVTLGELLQENGSQPIVKAANVRDWPDIQYLYVLDMEPPRRLKADFSRPEQVMKALCDLLPDRLMWGSDAPFYSYGAAHDGRLLSLVSSYEREVAAMSLLSDNERAAILRGNTRRFLGESS